MGRIPRFRLLTAAGLVLSGVVCVLEAGAQPSPAGTAAWTDVPLVRASQLAGRLQGTVTDVEGAPLSGVAVTAQGAQLQFAVTDREGRFVFESLPPGPYFVRAHLPGFVASRREVVEVEAARAATRLFRLSRVSTAETPLARPVLEASIGGAAPEPDAELSEEVAASEHDHSATAWRLRHLKRSVLREAEPGDTEVADATPPDPADGSQGGWSFFGDLPFSGQVQLLTTSSFDTAAELFSGSRLPRGVAYVAITAPVGRDSTWAVQGALSDGDVASWVLGGSYASKVASRHALDVGMSYAAQSYDSSSSVLLLTRAETSRTAGAVHAFDQWSLSPRMEITAGARYARYGYLENPALFSPSAEWRWNVGGGNTLRALVSQQMVAPGAEEFVPSPVAAVWMPPQRTFSPLRGAAGFRAERARHLEVGFEHEVASLVIMASGFRQLVNDQIVTIFGLTAETGPRPDLGHYFTATAGHFEAYGWSVAVSRPVASRVRGSVAYSQTYANWLSSPEAAVYTRLARSAARGPEERFHDVTTTVETDIPETATRVYANYKLNTGYTNGDRLVAEPGFDARFDVQISQRLPFVPLGDSEWEVLVAVRNLFRDSVDGGSVYDELLVVRPPKRLVGGLLVRF